MTSSVVKSDQTVYQNFSDIRLSGVYRFYSDANWPNVEKNVADRTRSAFYHPDQRGESSRLDTEAVLESVRKLLGSTVASKSEPAFDPWESPRHLEAAAVMDRLARGLLWKISDCTFIPGPEVVDLADDYDGLRAVLRVVRAGWATAAPDGLLVTDHGRDVASRMFVDR